MAEIELLDRRSLLLTVDLSFAAIGASSSSIFTTSYSYFVAEMEVELFSALLAEEPLMISSTFVIS